MKSRDFCFWLQGYLELNEGHEAINLEQQSIIKAHLALVFKHEIDPEMGDKAHQESLNNIHGKHGIMRC